MISCVIAKSIDTYIVVLKLIDSWKYDHDENNFAGTFE